MMAAVADKHARAQIAELRARLDAIDTAKGKPPGGVPFGTLARVLDLVSDEFGVPREALARENRARELSHPRQVAMLIAARHRGYSTPRIGRALRRDHSTVVYGIRAAEARAAQDPDLARRIDRVVEQLHQQERTAA